MNDVKKIFFLMLLIVSGQSYSQNAYKEVSNQMVGRWFYGKEIGCTDPNSTNVGVFYSLNQQGQIISETRDSKSTIKSTSLIKDVEYVDKKSNQFKLVSETSDPSNASLVTKKSIVEFDPNFNTIKILDLEVDGTKRIKNNIDLSTNTIEGIAGFKCNKNPTSSNKKNQFGINGLILGEEIPSEYVPRYSNPPTTFNEETAYFASISNLNIAGGPYTAGVFLYNNKIAKVHFYDNFFMTEIVKHEGTVSRFNPKLPPLTIIDNFSKYSNDIVLNINELLGNPKGQPKIQNRKVDLQEALIVPMMVVTGYKTPEQFKNLSATDKEKFNNIFNPIVAILNKQCPKCKSNYYKMDWNIQNIDVEVKISVPEKNDMPFPGYSIQIIYSDKELMSKISDVVKRSNKERIAQ
jgi:hypothetical protein